MRNSVSVGDGIYKSNDGGASWLRMGLRDSEHIVKIIVDPASPNTVYVCVPGKLWSDSDDRGVYKTTDGGKTWAKILAGTNALHRMLDALDGLEGSQDALRRHVGFPPPGLDDALRRQGPGGAERQRAVQERGWRRHVERAR